MRRQRCGHSRYLIGTPTLGSNHFPIKLAGRMTCQCGRLPCVLWTCRNAAAIRFYLITSPRGPLQSLKPQLLGWEGNTSVYTQDACPSLGSAPMPGFRCNFSHMQEGPHSTPTSFMNNHLSGTSGHPFNYWRNCSGYTQCRWHIGNSNATKYVV